MDELLIINASIIAADKHSTQFRKYDESPYFTHLKRVAGIAEKYELGDTSIAAAYLHDILEDYKYTKVYEPSQLARLLLSTGADAEKVSEVVSLVIELTDIYTVAKHPDKNRKVRKALEAERLSNISHKGKLIKLADLIDNTSDITVQDPNGFAPLYLKEKAAILAGFGEVAFHPLYQIALDNTAQIA